MIRSELQWFFVPAMLSTGKVVCGAVALAVVACAPVPVSIEQPRPGGFSSLAADQERQMAKLSRTLPLLLALTACVAGRGLEGQQIEPVS